MVAVPLSAHLLTHCLSHFQPISITKHCKMWNGIFCLCYFTIFQGLYLNSKGQDNFTPLLCSAWKGQTEAGRTLLRYGADIKALDIGMKSCLHWAAEMEHIAYINMLFEPGHDGEQIIDCRDNQDQSALFYAAEVGNVQVHLIRVFRSLNFYRCSKKNDTVTLSHHF